MKTNISDSQRQNRQNCMCTQVPTKQDWGECSGQVIEHQATKQEVLGLNLLVLGKHINSP